MKKILFVLPFLILFISCNSKSNEIVKTDLDKKANLVYGNLLLNRAISNLLVNNRLDDTKLELDTLFLIEPHINNTRFSARLYRLNGYLSGIIRDSEKSNNYFDKAESIFLKLNEYSDLALISNYRTLLMRGSSKEDEMEKILINALKLSEKHNDTLGILHVTHEMSAFYSFDLEDHEKGVYYGNMFFELIEALPEENKFEHSDEVEHSLRVNHTTPMVDLFLSTSKIALGKFDEAKLHLDKILPFFEEYEDYEKVRRIHLDYMKIYRSKLKFKEFDYHFTEYKKNSKNYNDYIINRSNKAFRLNESINKELSNLKFIEKEFELNKKIEEKNKIIIQLLGVVVLLSVIALIYFANRNKFLKKINNMINEDSNSTKQLALKLENIINDRNQLELKIRNIQQTIAIDLHDNFGNTLSGIISTSEVLKDILNSNNKDEVKLNHFLNNLDMVTEKMVQDLKDLIWSNNVENNEVQNISYRFKNVTIDFAKINNIKITYQEVFDNAYVLPMLWNRQLLLVFKEAINNACKYSNATLIKTGLKVTNDGVLELFVIDNGNGFDMNDIKKSGIFNMRKRAESIECKLFVESSIKHGTKVFVKGKLQIK